MDDTIEVQADFKSRLARKKERDAADADTITTGIGTAEPVPAEPAKPAPSDPPPQNLVEGESNPGATNQTKTKPETPEVVDVTTNTAPRTHAAPRPSKPVPPEVWRLVGPGLRQLPSAEYLRKIEAVKPGTIAGLLTSVQIDLDLTREQFETAHNNAITITTTRIIAYLCYAGFAFLGAIVLYLLGFIIPGSICAALSVIALILSSNFFSRSSAEPKTSGPTPPTKPHSRRRPPSPQNSTQAG